MTLLLDSEEGARAWIGEAFAPTARQWQQLDRFGAMLVAEGVVFHVPKGYLYFAIAFSMGVEALNLTATKRRRRLQAAQANLQSN